MESLHIIKSLWNLSNIGAENSDTRIKLERDSLGRVVKEWQDAHWDGVQCAGAGDEQPGFRRCLQHQETDWRFLKRMASQLGLPLVPDTSYYYPRFYLGLPEGEKRELGEIISCDLCFDGRYYAVSGKCLVDREDFICYDVVTRTSLSLGDRVTYEGRELLVSRKKQNWQEGRSSLHTALRETVMDLLR